MLVYDSKMEVKTWDDMLIKYPCDRSKMDKVEEREYVRDCFKLYEQEGFANYFWTRETELENLRQCPLVVLSRLEEADCDLASLPMWYVQIQGAGGGTICVTPDEIIPSEMKSNGCTFDPMTGKDLEPKKTEDNDICEQSSCPLEQENSMTCDGCKFNNYSNNPYASISAACGNCKRRPFNLTDNYTKEPLQPLNTTIECVQSMIIGINKGTLWNVSDGYVRINGLVYPCTDSSQKAKIPFYSIEDVNKFFQREWEDESTGQIVTLTLAKFIKTNL